MEISIQLSPDDVASFQSSVKQHVNAGKRHFWRAFVQCLVIGAVVAHWSKQLVGELSLTDGGYGPAGMMALLVFTSLVYLVAQWRAIHQPKQYWQRFAERPQHLTITPLGWAVRVGNNVYQYNWEQVHAFEETDERFFLFLTPQRAVIVPKRAFSSPENAEAFASAVRGYWAGDPNNVSRTLLDHADVEAWQRRPHSELRANLRAGLRLALGRSVTPQDFSVTTSQLVRLLLISTMSGMFLHYLAAFPNPQLDVYGIAPFGIDTLFFLMSGFIVAGLMGHVGSAHRFLVMLSSVSIVVVIPAMPAYIASAVTGSVTAAWIAYSAGIGLLVWLIAAAYRAILLLYQPNHLAALFATGVYALFTGSTTFLLPETPLFYPASANNDAAYEDRINVEDTFYSQLKYMQTATRGLKAQRPELADMYFVGFAGEANEPVFALEVDYVKQLFDERFDTEGRSLALINSPASVDTTPIASVNNLRSALRGVAEHMDRDNDVLFLFLTSHGSRYHELSVRFWPLPLNRLPAEELKMLLDESGIRNRVVVVSACYAGGFIDALQDDNSLIIAAAARDKTSFGCGTKSTFTYFSEAYFKNGLGQTTSFIEAYDIARRTVEQREKTENLAPSQPQIFIGKRIGSVLENLATRFTARTP